MNPYIFPYGTRVEPIWVPSNADGYADGNQVGKRLALCGLATQDSNTNYGHLLMLLLS